ncbi:hypothetical protein BH23GEM6_BH23GEM6_12050 [soil metagenome]
MRFRHLFLFSSAASYLFLASPAMAQDGGAEGAGGARQMQADRLSGEIRIDGRLDEADWERAVPATDFTESYPNPGAAANERTEARILWDDQALYVGVRMYDSSPDSIAAPLARRDASGIYSDWVHVLVDSYHDRRTAFRFSVNPRGVQRDVYMFNDGNEDGSWDAVWQGATQIDSLGWTAEYRIPLSQLRYQAVVDGERVWGIQIMRDIARREQRLAFSPWDRRSPGFVSRFGELRGIDGIRPVRRLEIQPYTSARLTRAPGDTLNPFFRGNDGALTAGADVKVGLTSGLTLTATINPDFGQVELDPAIINLSAFESFFAERRPFFVEGADVFRFGQVRTNINLDGQTFFYSRRIGRSPQRLLQGGQYAYVDAPQETSILGAAKVTGKIGPWTVGTMNALTDRELARFTTPDGDLRTSPVEPKTNFFLSRVAREFRTGRSVVGSMFSATNRSFADDEDLSSLLRSDAYFGGLDFEHSWAARAWTLSGYLAGSHVQGSTAAMTRTQRSAARYFQRPDAGHVDLDPTRTSLSGHIGEVALRHLGSWDMSLGYKESSPGFELNDLGFQGPTDYRVATAMVGRRINQPGRLFRERSGYSFVASRWNFDGDRTTTITGGGANGTLNNLFSVGMEGIVVLAAFDERLTRGGPMARQPAGYQLSSHIGSPSRNPLALNGQVQLSGADGGSWSRQANLNADWRPSTAVRLQMGPSLSVRRQSAQFITSTPDLAAEPTFGRRYIFGEIDQTTVGLSTRVDWTFTPGLSLQLYAQPFIAAGRYSDFKEFAAPRTFDFDVYGRDRGTICRYGELLFASPVNSLPCPAVQPAGGDPDFTVRFQNPDFNLRSLRGNAVLRWEYNPGSSLFFVWQQQRSGILPIGTFDLTHDVDGILNAPATNVFLIKATYWIGR